MNNTKFKKVENIKEYLINELKKGTVQAGLFQKWGEISARVGIPGEEITTIMSDGLRETKNTVSLDENGCPGMVVKNSTGEEYIVAASDFQERYEKIPGTENRFRPLSNPINACRVCEDICFIAPWGEMFCLAAGGYLVYNKDVDNIYGIQESEFNKTYRKADSD